MKITPRILAYLTLLVHWGPSNGLSYAWGFLLFGFIGLLKPSWFFSQGPTKTWLFRCVLIFAALFLVSVVVNAFLLQNSLNNTLWGAITLGSSLLTLLIFISLPFGPDDARKIFWFSLGLTLLQCGVGYYQMLDAQSFRSLNPFAGAGIAAGDNFVGTTFDLGIGNLVAIKMSLTALLFIPLWFADRSLKNSILLVCLLIGWVLPSAIYTLLIGFIVVFFFFIARGLLRALLTIKVPTSIFYATVTGMVLIALFVYIQRDNVNYAVESIRQMVSTAERRDRTQASGKVIYVKDIFSKLIKDYPQVPLIGVGPGNYSSRSAWLVSGEYLEHQPEFIPVTPSEAAKKYMIPLWSKRYITPENKGMGSIANQPFSTWFSLFTELGIGAVVIMSMILYTLYTTFKKVRRNTTTQFQGLLAQGLMMSLLYITLLFFVDNLLEWPLVMAQFFVFAGLLVRSVDANQTSA